MKFVSLKVENLLACNYEIEFGDRYTVIIGSNRQGKTLTARLLMLALYGIQEGKIHESWKLKSDELLPLSDEGSVELVIEKGRKYKIRRTFRKGKTKKSSVDLYSERGGSWKHVNSKDRDIKKYLEEEVGITPGLMNVVMSNEQGLIGSICYDNDLQTDVWKGWEWRTEIIRNNIKQAERKCGEECRKLQEEIEEIRETINSILKRWVEKGIFSKDEAEKGMDEKALEAKLSSTEEAIRNIEASINRYSEFVNALIELDDLDDKETIESVIKICERKREFLDEKDDIDELKAKCENYLNILTEVLGKGGKEGIQNKIRDLDDERKKLGAAKGLTDRKEEPIKAECEIFPPEDGEKLIVQIPDNIAKSFRYEDIASGGIAVPYDEKKLKDVEEDKEELETLLNNFEKEKGEVKEKKDYVRKKIGGREEELRKAEKGLSDQRSVLEADKNHYLKAIIDEKDKRALLKRLDTAKDWLEKLFNALSEEESLREIRKNTVTFINRIFEKAYGWDINARLEDEDKIVIVDSHGNFRSRPSGSEKHIMGLAWRWMIARAFDLPLVLDELEVLLDERNFDRTKRLIKEEMDRQTIILTLREGLKELPGKAYRVKREGKITVMEEIHV